MIQIKNNRVVLSKELELDKRKLAKLNSLASDADKKQYIMSLMGLSRERLNVYKPEKYTSVVDKLARKSSESVLTMLRDRQDNSSNSDHAPAIRYKNSQWIGVEIECLVPGESETDCESCCNSGESTCYNCDGRGYLDLEDHHGNSYRVDCGACDGSGSIECSDCGGNSGRGNSRSVHEKIRSALRREKITLCSVKSDGSLSSDDHDLVGVEVTVLFDSRHGFDKIRKVCKVLNDLDARVNSTCGLHVHIDQHNRSKSDVFQAANNFKSFLPILSRLVPKSRRSNSYCKLSVSAFTGDRYHAVNLTSYAKHNTIEIRLHSGTTDSNKIEHWTNLLLNINSLDSTPKAPISTMQCLFDALKLTPEQVVYFARRYQKFNPEESLTPNQDESGDEIAGVDSDLAEAV